jgi:hypothetical protein
VSPLPVVRDHNGPHYTRAQVLELERPAWTSDGRDVFYYFDGINAWILDGDAIEATVPQATPADGWWHKPRCHCAGCRDTESGQN